MARPRRTPARRRTRPPRARAPSAGGRSTKAKGFVGRDPSPVLDRYPPKDPQLAPRGPPPTTSAPVPSASTLRPVAAPATGPAAPPARSAPPPADATPLITLDRPFDLDEFSSLLGETSVRVTVPREALPEVLRRVTEFMDFGIYVYAVTVRPAPVELLKSFVVELQRVDYSAEKGNWVPFVEKGATDSPFGPTGDRR